MKALLLILLSAQYFLSVPGGNERAGSKEELVQIDTVRISPGMKPMVFKYFSGNDEYKYSYAEGTKMFGRFEVYFPGNPVPFQRDTLQGIVSVSYVDANFDNYLDLEIIKMMGASGGDWTDIYFYDPTTNRFKFGLGDLSGPSIDKEDSTISTWTSCCMGRMGSSDEYKFIDGEFQLFKSYWYSEEASHQMKLIGNSLVTTSRDTTIQVSEGVFIDSSWSYCFGKLRLVDVTKKKALSEPPDSVQTASGTAYQDVMGSFLYEWEEVYKYTRAGDGKIMCARVYSEVKDGRWVRVHESHRLIQN